MYKMADQAAFDACDFSSAKQVGTGSSGPVTDVFTGVETFYACEVSSHCNYGQKLAASATSGGGMPAAAPAPAAPAPSGPCATAGEEAAYSVGDVAYGAASDDECVQLCMMGFVLQWMPTFTKA